MHDYVIDLNGKNTTTIFEGKTIKTGGEDASPYDLFIASMGTCAILTAAGYCRRKELPTEGFKVNIDTIEDADTGLATEIKMEFVFPADFPENEKARVVKAAGTCFVKKHLYAPPVFTSTIA